MDLVDLNNYIYELMYKNGRRDPYGSRGSKLLKLC